MRERAKNTEDENLKRKVGGDEKMRTENGRRGNEDIKEGADGEFGEEEAKTTRQTDKLDSRG